jgi:hypothetical protein
MPRRIARKNAGSPHFQQICPSRYAERKGDAGAYHGRKYR